MANMWSPSSKWFLGSFAAPLVLTLLNVVMLISVRFDVEGIKQGRHADTLIEKVSFSACLLLCCLQFVVMLRFATIGSTIYTVRTTISSGAVNQTLFIFGLLFMSFTLILLVWNRGDDSLLILAAFRGWLFADGDGFNDMGMKVMSTKAVFALFAAFFFNVMTLNIIIAVYGHEYDKAHEDRKFMFLRGRVHYCTSSIISSYIIPWRGKNVHRSLLACAWFMIAASMYTSLHLHNSLYAGVLLGLGERLLTMTLMQCEWFSPEGVDSDAGKRFLWICYSDDWQSWLGGYEKDEQQQHGKGLAVFDEEQGEQVNEPRETSGISATSVASGNGSRPSFRRGSRGIERIMEQFKQLEIDLERCAHDRV